MALEDSEWHWRALKYSGELWGALGALEGEYEKIWVVICVRGAEGYLDWVGGKNVT